MTVFSTTVSDSFYRRWCPDPTRIYDVGELYAEFNARFFNGQLPILSFVEFTDKDGEVRRKYPRIRWDGKYRKLYGTYKPNGQGTGEIRLARGMASDPVQVRSTLLHEMVHAYLDQTGRDDGIKGHGPNFILEASRINAKCEELNFSYRVNFYDVAVTKQEPEVFSDLLKTTIYCGKDLDLARKMKTVLNAAFDARYVYEQ